MAYFIQDHSVAGLYGSGDTNANSYHFRNGSDPFASPGYANNPDIVAAMSDPLDFNEADLGDVQWPPGDNFAGVASFIESQLHDYRFRLWVIPRIMNINNPRVAVDIPFRLWNTNPISEQITDIDIVGSEVLTFDVDTSTVILDSQFYLANVQIGEGESQVTAEITFTTTNLVGILNINAVLIETFDIIPDVPLKENWEFLTDIQKNYLGNEQRVALRRYPRIAMDIKADVVDFDKRREIYDLIKKNIVVQSLVPQYQYGTYLSADANAAATKVFLDPARSNMRAGSYVIIVNPSNADVQLSIIDSIEADGINLQSSLSSAVTKQCLAFPGILCTLEDRSGLKTFTNSSEVSIKANSIVEPTLLRPSATRTIDTFDGIPWINRRPITEADEQFEYRRDIIDNETGVRSIASRDLHPAETGERSFLIQRISDPDEMDYWRSLFDTIRGSQRSFLLSTWAPDLTIVDGFGPLSGLSQIVINEGGYYDLYYPYETWKRIEIEYAGGNRTQHLVTTVNPIEDGTLRIGLDPAIPNETENEVAVKISFLERRRASDRVVLEHYAMYTEINFGVVSSDT